MFKHSKIVWRVEYFSGLLGKHVSEPLFIQMDIISLMEFSCYDSQQTRLIKPFTREDILSHFSSLFLITKQVFLGYNPKYFTSCWSVVGGEIISSLEDDFKSRFLLKQLNTKNLALISKNSQLLQDFRFPTNLMFENGVQSDHETVGWTVEWDLNFGN